ncbi:MAG: cyclic nucleotide-binding domain-containing protein [Nitrospinae bacterium]|nr:cyclic nucleotide-binding domain-containing protein [Nitrospinota bacterium]
MSKKLSDYSQSEIIKSLKDATSLSNDFTDDEIIALADIVEVEEYNASEVLLQEESTNRDLMVIKDGGVSIEVKTSPNQDTTIQIQKVRRNNVIGELSYIDGSRRSADVKAITETIVFRLPYESLDNLCKSNHPLGYKLMRNLAMLVSSRLRNGNFEIRSHLYV